MNTHQNNGFPFVETDQYRAFADLCDMCLRHPSIVLVTGASGVGKSAAARQYASLHNPGDTEDASGVLYYELVQYEQSDRTLYNAIVAAITNEEPKNVGTSQALSEVTALLKQQQYRAIILDEANFLDHRGLDGVQTLHKKAGISIMLISHLFSAKLWNRVSTGRTITQHVTYQSLYPRQVKHTGLPEWTSVLPHITYTPDQQDADAIVQAICEVAGHSNGNSRELNLRRIVNVLHVANEWLERPAEYRQKAIDIGSGETSSIPELLHFDADLIYEIGRWSGWKSAQSEDSYPSV
jgi:hypothetical protein